MSVAEVRSLLERHGLQPSRERGQNFLVDETLAAQMVQRAGVEARDAVIEIGAGLGVLTRALAAKARAVVAIEVDAGLVRLLRDEKRLPDNVRLVHEDALESDLVALVGELGPPARLVANLPYAVSSPLLRRLLDLRQQLVSWTVLLQSEVAQRIAASPGGRDYGSLAVLHGLCVDVERVGDLRPGCFHPRPKVQSRALRMTPRPDSPLRDDGELAAVERVARAAFATRRKTLANALRRSPFGAGRDVAAWLADLGIDPRARAETLAPARFLDMARALEAA